MRLTRSYCDASGHISLRKRAPVEITALVADLKACSSLQRGKCLHDATIQSGLDSNIFVANTLIHMYAKCGSLKDAHEVFHSMNTRTVVSWTALILGYAFNGDPETALDLFSQMEGQGRSPNERTFLAAIKACTDLAVIEGTGKVASRGKALNLLARNSGIDQDMYVKNALLHMYAKCASMDEARSVFESMSDPDLVSWNALILGYADNGEGNVALSLFSRMRREGCSPDSRTFVAVLKVCSDFAVKEEANRNVESNVRGRALQFLTSRSGLDSDIYIRSALVGLYAKCGSMVDAHKAFNGGCGLDVTACSTSATDVVSWNALIMGYADNGESEMALDMFSAMRQGGAAPDARSFLGALKACTELAVKEEGTLSVEITGRGKALHLLVSRCGCDSDIFVKATLVDMYGKYSCMEDARNVFNSIQNPNVVLWTALILGYADSGEGEVALDLFSRMKREGCAPNERTFVAAAKACTDVAGKEGKVRFSEMPSPCENANHASVTPRVGIKVASKQRAQAVHLLALKTECDLDIFVKNTLVDMYSKCGCMDEAQRVLDSIKNPDVISWNSLILGYADNGQSEMALSLFSRVRTVAPDKRTFVAALKACTDLIVKEVGNGKLSNTALRLEAGKALHLLALKSGCGSDVYLKSTLVDMYAKAGFMDLARRAFNSMKHPNAVSWTVLISGYADNGDGHTSLDLFYEMKREGLLPDERTFIAALKACSVIGALETGKAVHAEICSRGLERNRVLANCLVDFYAKCGNLAEAEKVFESQPIRNVVTWTSLMTGYSRCGNTGAVFDLYDRMLDAGLQPNCVTYLCLLTACNHAGLVDKAEDYFEEMRATFGVQSDIEHYTCMVDILGRANKLDAAMALLRGMRFSPDVVTWTSILGACRKWGNVELGKLAFQSCVFSDAKNTSGAYILMANAGEDTEGGNAAT